MKRPAFMFYPADWRKDPELRVCSIAARGLWIDMIALMHEGEPYGHLVVNAVAVTPAQLARLVGEAVSVVKRLLGELETHHVFSRTEAGVIFSRRMVADEHIREVRAAAGKLGGNPALTHKPSHNGRVNGKVKQSSKQNPTPSVAVAVAVAPSGEKPSAAVADRPETPSAEQPAGEPPAGAKPDPFPKAVNDAVYEAWLATLGSVDYGRLRKALLPLYKSATTPHPTAEQLVQAVAAFLDARDADDPKWRGKYTPEMFASQLHDYVRMGGQAYLDEWGEATERGRMARILA